MRFTLQDGFVIYPAQVDIQSKGLTHAGKWTFVRPIFAKLNMCIWQCSPEPFMNPVFLTPSTSLIVRHIEKDLKIWLNPRGMEPVEVQECFALAASRHYTLSGNEHRDAFVYNEALTVALDYVYVVGKTHGEFSERMATSHLRWVPDTTSPPEYPSPDFHSLFKDSAGVSAVILCLRHPGPYDGGVEYMFEKVIKPTIDLLFCSYPVTFLSGTDCTPPTMTTANGALPLVVVGGSMELNDAARAKMATAVYPTLEEMVRDHDVAVPLPKHCFVYGIMWSKLYLHILIHFPLYVPGTNGGFGQWEFCQTVVAEYRLTFQEYLQGYLEYATHNQDDLVLDRWRLTRALVLIRRHVEFLNQWMYPLSKHCCNRDVVHISTIKRRTGRPHGSLETSSTRRSHSYKHGVTISQPTPSSPDLHSMCVYWQKSRFSVPSNWIPEERTIIDTEEGDIACLSKQQKHNLSRLYINRIRKYLIPLSKSTVLENHLSEDYSGPDFVHLCHSPRCHIPRMWRTRQDKQANTLPHLYRVTDFLSMSAATWPDVNIFVANVLAGFSAYAVRWNPTVRYPFDHGLKGSCCSRKGRTTV